MFANIFTNKISKRRLNVQSNPYSTPIHFVPSTPPVLRHFTPATLSEILHLLSQSPNLHCNLDPIPTAVLKKIVNEIAMTIISIINLSLLTGNFSSLKSSLISPLLKKTSHNKEDLSNYRLIAILSVVSKIT